MFFAAIEKTQHSINIIEPFRNTSEALANSKNISDIIFLCSSPDEEFLKQLIYTIKSVENDLTSKRVPSISERINDAYVYAYFEQAEPSWDEVFYVGKGNKERDISHTKEVLNKLKKNLNLTGRKEKLIHRCISESNIKLGAEAKGNFIHKLYSHNGKYSDKIAFFVEYYLVNRARSPQKVSNKTEGNYKTGDNVALVQPITFDVEQKKHYLLWEEVAKTFLKAPESKRICNTLRPSLKFIGFEKDLENIDRKLYEIGLKPFNMRGISENRLASDLMIAINVSISGASDAMISYVNNSKSKPYRFDLRIKSGSSSVIINLRPLSNSRNEKQNYINFFSDLKLEEKHLRTAKCELTSTFGMFLEIYDRKGLASPLKNTENWPFFKPAELTPKNKRAKGIAFDFIDFEEATICSPPWLKDSEHELTLTQAIETIDKIF